MGGVIVHEWLEKVGGSENTLQAMAEALPDADLLCLWNNAQERFPNRLIKESVLARTPLRDRKAVVLPLLPLVWRGQRNQNYDWALVSSHAFAQQVSFRHQRADFQKLVYAYTPARYVWTPQLDVRGSNSLLRMASIPLKAIDRHRAKEAASVAAISAFVSTRIQATWRREARVIFPPVDVAEIQTVSDWATQLTSDESELLDTLPQDFLLGASRLIPYKRLDLVIRAGEATGRPVVIAGSGPEEQNLRLLAARASVPVTFVGGPSNSMLRALYQRAFAFVFPAVEDFGIMPVEAMALGTPVVGGNLGGVTETVVHGTTGIHVDDWGSATLGDQIRELEMLDPAAIRHHARSFSKERFVRQLHGWMAETLR
jgi:glycosyltransferase involved in cell wall biosynthesis